LVGLRALRRHRRVPLAGARAVQPRPAPTPAAADGPPRRGPAAAVVDDRRPARGHARGARDRHGYRELSLSVELSVPRFAQPDDVTCGPTCLRQVLSFYGDDR